MSREREVKVTVLGDSSRGQKALRDLGDDADRADTKFGRLGTGVSAFSRNAIGALAGLGVATAVGGFLKGSIQEAEEARKVMAQTNAVIASTGGVAKVSAADVDSLASSLSAMSGIDDEVIAGGQNLLLTFTNVRNEVGKGNDIFNQGTKAALNMSVALGTDMNSASMLVGKALNDPIKGMAALTRSGIQFTEQQKAQVKAMVASGDMLGAQKIILKELETQFGGSAAAAASPMARLKVAFGNLQEEVGARLLPVLSTVATFLADRLPGALDAAGRVIGPIFREVTGAIRAFVIAFQVADGDITSSGFAGTMERIGFIVRQVFDFIRDHAQPVLIALGVAIGLLISPIGLVVGALIYAYTQFELLRTVVDAVVQFLLGTVVPAVAAFAGFVAEQFGALVGWSQEHWASIQEAIGHVIAVVQGIIEVFIAVVRAAWQTWGDELVNVATIVWDQIRNVVETVVNLVRGIIEVALAVINGEWGAAWEGIKGILATAWEFIRETVVNALRMVGQAIEAGLSAIVGLVGGLPGRALDALGSLGGWLFGAGQDLIWGFVNGIGSMARRLADAAVNVARGAVNAVKNFLGIGSPSKVFMGFGLNVGEGLALGMGRSEQGVSAAARSLSGAAIAGADTGLADRSLAGTADASAGGEQVGPSVLVQIANLVGQDGMYQLAEILQAQLLKKDKRVVSLGLT
jgi:phage-related protein